MSSDNVSGADNQQETERDPQRLYAERSLAQRLMRQSEPHGDMRRAAEMTVPPLSFQSWVEVTEKPKVAKFLVG
jgi:hypothetical protein